MTTLRATKHIASLPGLHLHLLPEDDAEALAHLLRVHKPSRTASAADDADPFNRAALHAVASDGGFTVHDHMGDGPTSGYMVSLSKTSEKSIPLANLEAADITAYRTRYATALKRADCYLGAWVFEGNVYLDVSQHVGDRAHAIDLAHQRDQLGIFDLGSMSTIDTQIKSTAGRKTATIIGRGTVDLDNPPADVVFRGVNAWHVEDTNLLKKVIAHTVTAADLLRLFTRGTIGNFWAQGPEWDVNGAMDHAESELQGAWLNDYFPTEQDDGIGVGIPVVFIARKPKSGFGMKDWDWTYGERPEGVRLSLIEIWYNDGTGWRCVPAAGLQVTSQHTPASTPGTERGGSEKTATSALQVEPMTPAQVDAICFFEGREQPCEGVHALIAGAEVGWLLWYAAGHPEHALGEIATVYTYGAHRHEGVASAMLAEARRIEPAVHHSADLSDAGEAWSQHVGGRNGSLPVDLRLEVKPSRRGVLAWLPGNLIQEVAESGYAITEDIMVGELNWADDGMISWVVVYYEEFRRRGLADAMWGLAKATDSRVHHSQARSKSGDAWAHSTGDSLPRLNNTAALTAEARAVVPGLAFNGGPRMPDVPVGWPDSASERFARGFVYEGTYTHGGQTYYLQHWADRNIAGIWLRGDRIGWMDWMEYTDHTGVISTIGVEPEYQHRGLASALLAFAEHSAGYPLEHSILLTPDGTGWSHAVGAKTTHLRPTAVSWRDRGSQPTGVDAFISPDTGRSRGNLYSVWLYGSMEARFPRLKQAREYVEAIYGPLTWEKVPGDQEPHWDEVHGNTTEFNDAGFFMVVRHLPRLGAQAALKVAVDSGVWYHTGDPSRWQQGQYSHLGTMNSVLDRRMNYPTRGVWKITINPRHPLNTPSTPLEDFEANILGEWMVMSHGSGEAPGDKVEGLRYPGDVKDVIAKTGWTPATDAIYYSNFVEGKGDVSVMVLASAVVSKTEMIGNQEPLWGSTDQFGYAAARTAVLRTSGVYWRTHDRDRAFSVKDATSTPLSGFDAELDREKGYSCFANPWHLYAYVVAHDWYEFVMDNDDLVAFSGKKRRASGVDGEDLVMPDMATVDKMSWGAFEAELVTTPRPADTRSRTHPSWPSIANTARDQGLRDGPVSTMLWAEAMRASGWYDLHPEQDPKRKTASTTGTLIARGLTMEVDQHWLALKAEVGTLTAQDILAALHSIDGRVGAWWGIVGAFADLDDWKNDWAWVEDEETVKAALPEHADYPTINGTMGIVLVAKRPTFNGKPWDPDDVDDDARGYEIHPLMGNSGLPASIDTLDLVEVHYNAGWGWKTLPATGMRAKAARGYSRKHGQADDPHLVGGLPLRGACLGGRDDRRPGGLGAGSDAAGAGRSVDRGKDPDRGPARLASTPVPVYVDPLARQDYMALPTSVRSTINRAVRGLHQREGNIKALSGTAKGYRLRVGDYRVVYFDYGTYLHVLIVGHRRDVYPRMQRRLGAKTSAASAQSVYHWENSLRTGGAGIKQFSTLESFADFLRGVLVGECVEHGDEAYVWPSQHPTDSSYRGVSAENIPIFRIGAIAYLDEALALHEAAHAVLRQVAASSLDDAHDDAWAAMYVRLVGTYGSAAFKSAWSAGPMPKTAGFGDDLLCEQCGKFQIRRNRKTTALTTTAIGTYQTSIYQAQVEIRVVAKKLSMDQAGDLARRVLVEAGFPDADEAYAVSHPHGGGRSSVAWGRDEDRPGIIIPLVALATDMMDELTVLHECAHILYNGVALRGIQSTDVAEGGHNGGWLKVFYDLVQKYATARMREKFNQVFGNHFIGGVDSRWAAKTAGFGDDLLCRGINRTVPVEVWEQMQAGSADALLDFLSLGRGSIGNVDSIGLHWTPSPARAELFARPKAPFWQDGCPWVSMMLTARVPLDQRLDRSDPRWSTFVPDALEYDVEDEVALAPGTPITMVNVHYWDERGQRKVLRTSRQVTAAGDWTEFPDPAGMVIQGGGDAVQGGYNGFFAVFDRASGKRMGYIDYQSAREDGVVDVKIGMVEVEPEYRRKGIATLLFKRLQHEFQGVKIDPGYTTDDGTGWWRAVAKTAARVREHATMVDLHHDRDMHTVVAQVDGETVGWLIFADWGPSLVAVEVDGKYVDMPGNTLPVDGVITSVGVDEDFRRQGIASDMLAFARTLLPSVHHNTDLTSDGRAWSQHVGALVDTDFEGTVGNRDHITRTSTGTVPTSSVAHLLGRAGEKPGEHRNKTGPVWGAFLADIKANGITSPIFITVDYYQEPKISEGNHRRDAAVELGLAEVPVEVRYYGHAEQLTSLAMVDDYAMSHQPLLDGPSIDRMEEMFGPDVYTHPEWYGVSPEFDRPAARVLQACKGKPDTRVTIYRALPPGHLQIETGNWVTTVLAYARQHAKQDDDPKNDWPVISAEVAAKYVVTGGSDIVEWGYNGPSISARLAARTAAMPAGIEFVQMSWGGTDGVHAYIPGPGETPGIQSYIGGHSTGLGHLYWYPRAGVDDNDIPHQAFEISLVDVKAQYRRQGVAKAMFEFALTIEPRLHHSPVRSDSGDAFARSMDPSIAPRGYSYEYGVSDPVKVTASRFTFPAGSASRGLVLKVSGALAAKCKARTATAADILAELPAVGTWWAPTDTMGQMDPWETAVEYALDVDTTIDQGGDLLSVVLLADVMPESQGPVNDWNFTQTTPGTSVRLAKVFYSPGRGWEELDAHGITKSAANWTHDDVPLPIGQTSIPGGTVRGFHVTDISNEDSIRRDGLQLSHSRGQQNGEPVAIWFGNEPWYGSMRDNQMTVEVAIPQGTPTGAGELGGTTFAILRDVPPEQIVAIHLPWHGTYRYLQKAHERGRYQTREDLEHAKGYDEKTNRAVDKALREWTFLPTTAAKTASAGQYVRGFPGRLNPGEAVKFLAMMNSGDLRGAGMMLAKLFEQARDQPGGWSPGGMGHWWAPMSTAYQVEGFGGEGTLGIQKDDTFGGETYLGLDLGMLWTGTPQGPPDFQDTSFPSGTEFVMDQVRVWCWDKPAWGYTTRTSGKWLTLPLGGLRVKAAETDYSRRHQPQAPEDEDSEPIWDMGAVMYPKDVYDRPGLYPDGNDRELQATLRAVRGKPDATLMIYRAVPMSATVIEHGNWVTISRAYAQRHGEAGNAGPSWHIIETRVKASDVYVGDGNSLAEWGYWGPSITVRTASKRTDIVVQATEHDTGVMICLTPPKSVSTLLVNQKTTTEALDEQHITLLYLGTTDEVDHDALIKGVEDWASTAGVIAGSLTGYGTFENPDENVLYAAWDLTGGKEWRTSLVDALRAVGVERESDYGEWVAHQTLAYADDPFTRLPTLPKGLPDEVVFGSVSVAFGPDWTTYSLKSGHTSRTAHLVKGQYPA